MIVCHAVNHADSKDDTSNNMGEFKIGQIVHITLFHNILASQAYRKFRG